MTRDQKTYANYPEVWEEEGKCNSEAHSEELGLLAADPKSSHYDAGGMEKDWCYRRFLVEEREEDK